MREEKMRGVERRKECDRFAFGLGEQWGSTLAEGVDDGLGIVPSAIRHTVYKATMSATHPLISYRNSLHHYPTLTLDTLMIIKDSFDILILSIQRPRRNLASTHVP